MAHIDCCLCKALDPGNALFCDWFKDNKKASRNLVVDVGGGNGHVSTFLAEQFPDLSFEVQDISQTLLTQGQQNVSPALQQRIQFNQRDMFKPQPIEAADKVLAYVMRNVLWNWSDDDCVKLLQTFIPVMDKSPDTVLLVNDGMSPAWGMFEPHVDKAYRRRDVTVMTMHNTKQRTKEEWRELFEKASPHFEVRINQTQDCLDLHDQVRLTCCCLHLGGYQNSFHISQLQRLMAGALGSHQLSPSVRHGTFWSDIIKAYEDTGGQHLDYCCGVALWQELDRHDRFHSEQSASNALLVGLYISNVEV